MMRRRTFLGSMVALSLPALARGQAPADQREPPFLHDKLRAAALPNLADRLPKTPRVIDLAGAVGIGARKRLRARFDAEADQPFALRQC